MVRSCGAELAGGYLGGRSTRRGGSLLLNLPWQLVTVGILRGNEPSGGSIPVVTVTLSPAAALRRFGLLHHNHSPSQWFPIVVMISSLQGGFPIPATVSHSRDGSSGR